MQCQRAEHALVLRWWHSLTAPRTRYSRLTALCTAPPPSAPRPVECSALECVQCLAERRSGGESGIQWVEALKGKAVWEAMRLDSFEAGGWSLKLFESCLSRSHTLQQPRSGDKLEANPGGSFCKRFPTLEEAEDIVGDEAVAYRFRYTDGTCATMLLMNGLVADFNVAARLRGRDELLSCQMYAFPTCVRPMLTEIYLCHACSCHEISSGRHGARGRYLDAGRAPAVPNNVQYSSITMSNAEKMFLSGVAPYPVERTLMTGGVVEAGCQSLTHGRRVLTPHMANIRYSAPQESLFGGHNEAGAYRAGRGQVVLAS
jgi:hypothetical protein